MNPKIHDILKQAGIAHGILHDEAEIVLVLSNPDLFAAFEAQLQHAADNGELTSEEHRQIQTEAKMMHAKARQAQTGFRDAVFEAHRESLEAFYTQKAANLREQTALLQSLPARLDSTLADS